MTANIIRGDARNLPLPDASVDLIVTSPPYFALRSYTDNGTHYGGQIGSEPTPAAYIAALIECTREWVRVLKPSGSIWVNLGDKYVNRSVPGDRMTLPAGGRPGTPTMDGHRSAKQTLRIKAPDGGMPPKSLMGLPWRYALACIDQLGLILRAEVIWSKPNGLPESVTDRVRRSHESWFHLTVAPRYFAAVDEIREALESGSLDHDARRRGRTDVRMALAHSGRTSTSNALGKLPGSVWDIPSQPLTVPAELGVDHFAAFPMEWPRRIILGWSPSGICVQCGEGRRPVIDKPGLLGGDNNPHSRSGTRALSTMDGGQTNWTRRMANPDRITGYACACPEPTAPTRPAVVLDPFGGTGTTALVASVLGRHGISVDRSADYCRLAQWRTTDPGQRAAAMQVEKPAPVHRDQLELFDGVMTW